MKLKCCYCKEEKSLDEFLEVDEILLELDTDEREFILDHAMMNYEVDPELIHSFRDELKGPNICKKHLERLEEFKNTR